VPAVAPAFAGRRHDANVKHGSADVRLRPNYGGQPSPDNRLKGGFRPWFARSWRASRSRSVTRPRSKSAKAESASQGKPQRLPQSARYLRRAHAAVRAELGSAEPLPAFLAGAGRLTLSDRRRIVQQSLVLLEQNYVHLPLKKAMHAVEPVQRLRLNDLLMDNADLFAAAGDLLD
jgi:hypothetical protein